MKRRDFLKKSFAALVIAATPVSFVKLIPETVTGWAALDSSPIDDIMAAFERVRSNTGYAPNTIAMTDATYDEMVGEMGAHERVPDELEVVLN